MQATTDTPSPLPLLRDAHPPLQRMIRALSRQRFEDISAEPDLRIEEHEHPDDFIYGSHLTVIQIAAKDLRLTFKSHFNLSDIARLTARAKTPAQVLGSAYDLFKEYSNLVAGGISQQLHACGIVAGISLPLATSGFDELIASDELRLGRHYDFWQVKSAHLKFVCSAYAEIFEDNLLGKFTFDENSLQGSEGGDVELL